MRLLALPKKYWREYREYISANPEPPKGKTYLRAFMEHKRLIRPRPEQKRIDEYE